MRILFTSRPTAGHLFPLLPLAEAARKAGHGVAFASAPGTVAQVREFGFEGFEAGREVLGLRERLELYPEMAALNPVTREWNFTRWFAGYEAPERAPELLAIGREWSPDLLVNDFAEPAGPAVASALGIRHATSGFGIPRPDLAELIVPWVEPTWTALGLQVPRYAGLFDSLFLDPCPPSMKPAGLVVPNRQPIGSAAGPPPRGDDARKLASLPPGQVVMVTFGTLFGNSALLYRTVIEAVSGLGRTVVVTLGPLVSEAELGPLPPDVFCFDFLSQGVILPRCDLVVTHGGSGSTLGPLREGVPLLVIPQGADQFDNAAGVARAEAGLVVLPAEFEAATIRARAEAILEGACAAGVGRVAAEMAAMPTPGEVVEVLARLAGPRA